MTKLDAVGSVGNDKTAVQQQEQQRQQQDNLLKEIKKQIIVKKGYIRGRTGSFKYDWCFDDCIDIIIKFQKTI